MMVTYRFVRLIEEHSDALAKGLLHRVQRSERTSAYSNVPPEELQQRVSEIYRHLGEWLVDKSDADVERRYMEIGLRRALQDVPLSQLIWAIIMTKDNLWEFILDEACPDRPVEIFGQQELLQLLDQFFDRAIHAAAVGYERAIAAHVKTENKARKAS